ncbi:putative leucine-rich repeat domain superfamily [Helianthus annuus]|nr:putative leucine-rich repeat domain superfamily [Helianthus annuus]
METLGLSYNHLPLHLRECFLYLGGFQEDYKFNVQRLTWLCLRKANEVRFILLTERSLSDVIASGFRSFELLRVLNLQNCRLNTFPKGMELLVHLSGVLCQSSSRCLISRFSI